MIGIKKYYWKFIIVMMSHCRLLIKCLLKNLFKFINIKCIFNKILHADVTKIAFLLGPHGVVHNMLYGLDLYVLVFDEIQREYYLP